MLATAMIVFREVLEAALIITLILGVTRGVFHRRRWISGGIVLGLTFSVLVAFFADVISSAVEGVGQEIFNATILFIAVGLLGWHNIWMQRHAKELVAQMKQWGNAVKEGEKPLHILTFVIALAVSREGSELVLFLNGILASGSDTLSLVSGGVLGLVGGIVLGCVMYFGLARIPTKHIFDVSGWLILLLAAGMASQGAAYLVQADILPSMGNALWNSSSVLSERSVTGQVLHTLVGYDDRPMGIQVVFYLATLLVIGGLMWLINGAGRNLSKAPQLVGMVFIAASLSVAYMPLGQAGIKVYSPYVEQGEWEVELQMQRTVDSNSSQDGATVVKPEFGYGVNSFWYTEFITEVAKNSGGEAEFEAVGWENIFQLTQQGEYWVDVGAYVEAEFATEAGNPNKLELKVLLEKRYSKISHTVNLITERKFGSNAEDEFEFGYAWRTKIRWSRQLEPAIEVFGEFGEASNFSKLSKQDHRVGPVLLGEYLLTAKSKIGYEVGYLFGINSASPQGTVKAVLEYEFRF